jgi:hypothetical protein
VDFTDPICRGEHEVERFDCQERSEECAACKAILWEGETTRKAMCCSGGKVALLLFEVPPEGSAAKAILDTWARDDRHGRPLRMYARAVNNALALASQTAKFPTPPGGGWSPTVVIQGKAYFNIGALRAAEGETPSFAQVYVLDDDFTGSELDLRVANSRLPPRASESDRSAVRALLETMQAKLRECNPYVADFVTLAEMPEAEAGNRTFVINSERWEDLHPPRHPTVGWWRGCRWRQCHPA